MSAVKKHVEGAVDRLKSLYNEYCVLVYAFSGWNYHRDYRLVVWQNRDTSIALMALLARYSLLF